MPATNNPGPRRPDLERLAGLVPDTHEQAVQRVGRALDRLGTPDAATLEQLKKSAPAP